MHGKKLTQSEKNKIWAHYLTKRRSYRRKTELYNVIAEFCGFCGWQTVYNVIKKELDARQYKLFE